MNSTIRLRGIIAVLLSLVVTASPCDAHVLQNMAWFETSREVEVAAGNLRIIHVCRFVPGRLDRPDSLIDVDSDTTVTQHEIADFCNQTARYLAQDVALLADSIPCSVGQESFLVFDDSSGFRSEMVADFPDTSETVTLLLSDPAFLIPTSVSGAVYSSAVTITAPDHVVLDSSNLPVRRMQIPAGPVTTLRLTKQSVSSRTADTTQSKSLTQP